MSSFGKKIISVVTILTLSSMVLAGMGLYPDTILGTIEFSGDGSKESNVQKCPTVKLQATFSKNLEMTQ